MQHIFSESLMKIRIAERMAYSRDNFMSRGASSIFLALLILFLTGFALIGLSRLLVEHFYPAGSAETTETFWTTFLELTDPGNMNQDNESSWYMRIFTVLSGMFGIVFFSAVIAFITTQLDRKLEELKKGRSRVIEEDHILILGWNQNIVEILNELIIANESEKDASVVILSHTDKEEMDDLLAEQVKDRKTTRIITRTGEISSTNALSRVAVEQARSVILLPECSANSCEDEKISADAHSLKTLLALLAACGDETRVPDTVVEIFQESNRQIIDELIPGKITLVSPEEMIAKITVQTSRTTGLGAVYSELFGFDGCEFYFTEVKDPNYRFGELVYHYPDGIPFGIRKESGEIIIKPSADAVLEAGDELLMIAEDDSTIHYKSKALITPKEMDFKKSGHSPDKEFILLIGWNSKSETILEQFLDYIIKGSEIHVLLEEKTPEAVEAVKKYNKNDEGIKIKLKTGNPLDIGELKNQNLEMYKSIVILNTVHHDQEVADARNINIFLLIRNLLQKSLQEEKVQIISEVMNADNLELISKAGVNDTIISTKMVSKILAQIAEEPDVMKIYDELFKEEGSEIYLKPLSYYTEASQVSVRFADLIQLAQKRDEICLGFRDMSLSHSVEEHFGIFINPQKDEVLELQSHDCLIVLAEDEL